MESLFSVGQWVWSDIHQKPGKVVEASSLWGEAFCHVWFMHSDSVVKVHNEQLQALASNKVCSAEHIAYVSAAAKIAACLHEQDVLLAPMGSNVIPLPHQLKALNRAISKSQVRYLLADEVGLGKTIEAGLIMRELKLRGLVKRILVVTPKGLATQWISEMQNHFNEAFQLLLPGEFDSSAENIWSRHNQVVCSMDSIKPIEKRRGWDLNKINSYNQIRFDNLVTAGWDLIIVDESHRLQGSTESVARFKLGQGLADAAPYFLLLSATPHQGKTDGFHRLMSLLDQETFFDAASITPERVKPYLIRTEKRQAIDSDGKALFTPRRTELISVEWKSNHALQRNLYDAVTDYVREGYNQALESKQNAIGFLMILMQRLVVSSPAAIKATLERRLSVLNKPALASQASLLSEEEWEDLDGQQQVDKLLNSKIKALKNEKQEVEWLLSLAKQCVEGGIDAKADALMELITTLQREENDPNLKLLIFTEFIPTQMMLADFLSSRGMSVATLNGSLSMEERKQVQQTFAGNTRILISTDAGGEGLNLQFCHVIINYDIPWNPMRIEQRIGRVDRIGQKRVVRAINLVFEESIEYRVREVLEEKLLIILEEFGVDKTSDVLDSAQAGHLFDAIYTGALQNPNAIDEEIEKALQELKHQAETNRQGMQLFADESPIDVAQAETLKNHPLPYWVERMTLNFLAGHEPSSIEQQEQAWRLTWEDGETWKRCVFNSDQAEADATLNFITLDQPKIRTLIQNLPTWLPGLNIPVVSIPTIPDSVDGVWGLWQISLALAHNDDPVRELKKTAYLPVYTDLNGKNFPATAKRIWEALLSNDVLIHDLPHESQTYKNPDTLFDEARQQAISSGAEYFSLLKSQHAEALVLEKEKSDYAFAARRRAIERVGLPEVKAHRLRLLEQEIEQWKSSYQLKQETAPELTALLVLKVSPAAMGSRNQLS